VKPPNPLYSSLFHPEWHEQLGNIPWNRNTAIATIQEIAKNTDRHFDRNQLWPEHPDDQEWSSKVPSTSLYWGASGVAHALHFLQSKGYFESECASIEVFENARSVYLGTPDSKKYSPGLYMGELGILLLQFRWYPSAALATAIERCIHATSLMKECDVMWGSPGGLIAAVKMSEWTSDLARWQPIIEKLAFELAHKLQEVDGKHLWAQNIGGSIRYYLGPVHGLTGNWFALEQAEKYLQSGSLDVTRNKIVHTLKTLSVQEGNYVNWYAHTPQSKFLLQFCHGAPGIILTTHRLWNVDGFSETLLAAAECTWHAGPLSHETGTCHGTAGNGHAFLRMHQLTADAKWLDRARLFAMHAIAQSDRRAKEVGRRRFSGLSGDLGLALYLHACIAIDPDFPYLEKF